MPVCLSVGRVGPVRQRLADDPVETLLAIVVDLTDGSGQGALDRMQLTLGQSSVLVGVEKYSFL